MGPFNRPTLETFVRTLDGEPPNTLVSMGNLGACLGNPCKLTGAGVLDRGALKACQRTFSNGRQNSLISRGDVSGS